MTPVNRWAEENVVSGSLGHPMPWNHQIERQARILFCTNFLVFAHVTTENDYIHYIAIFFAFVFVSLFTFVFRKQKWWPATWWLEGIWINFLKFHNQISPIILLRFSCRSSNITWGCGALVWLWTFLKSETIQRANRCQRAEALAGWNISYFTHLYFEFIFLGKSFTTTIWNGGMSRDVESSVSISNPMWNSKSDRTKPLKCCSESLLSLILSPTVYPRLNRINSLQIVTNCFFLGSWL